MVTKLECRISGVSLLSDKNVRDVRVVERERPLVRCDEADAKGNKSKGEQDDPVEDV